MAQVTLTPHLARHVPCPTRAVQGSTVRDVLEAYFAEEPQVRGYVLDDQGVLRKHVVIFVDGQQLISRGDLGQPVSENASLYIMQAYDIVYRHALDIDETGDLLAFGSTTGSLWITENQGDAWSRVGANLPPIYSVRFVK